MQPEAKDEAQWSQSKEPLKLATKCGFVQVAGLGKRRDLDHSRGAGERIVYTSDNGWQLPRGLANCYDAGTRVPHARFGGAGKMSELHLLLPNMICMNQRDECGEMVSPLVVS
jgi:hypothetical protein